MRVRSLAFCLALAAGTTSTALAQYPGGDPGAGEGAPGGMHHGRGMRHGGGGRGMQAVDPVVVEGPPAPADFARITSVPDTEGYARLYNHFMSTTRPQRDSLAAARGAMREAFDNQDREAGRGQMGAMKSLADDLSHQQETFDGAVKDLISKDQWKKYQDWRADRRKEAQDRRRNRDQ